jgi:hypothetical protein
MLETKDAPDFVAERIRARPRLKYIVPSSTPVVCFGDITQARVITIGINPSSSEFTKIQRQNRELLRGGERRLSNYESLDFVQGSELSKNQVDQVWSDCLNYFDGPFYEKWFSKMEQFVVNPLGASYLERSAAHVDLIQWATDPLWQEMINTDPEEAEKHLAADLPFLLRQLDELSPDVIFLSGTPVVETLSELFNLEFWGKTSVEEKRAQNKLFTGKFKNAVVLGTSMNVPDSHTSNAHREFLATWIKNQI